MSNLSEAPFVASRWHEQRGVEYESSGNLKTAAREYTKAISIDPEFSDARRRLAPLLVRLKQKDRALDLFKMEALSGPEGLKWFTELIVSAMLRSDLSYAAELAEIYSMLERGSEWYPGPPDVAPDRIHDAHLSTPKLLHDVNQLTYLREIGVLDTTFDTIIRDYLHILEELGDIGPNARVRLAEKDERMRRVYGRIVHLADAPRVVAALSSTWNKNSVQREYRERRPGIVVIDNFLTDEALTGLYKFCLESTVWFGNRYANGRLGAFFFSGFNCPLLIQIAEELRDQLPDLIGERYPLRQLWGFKNSQILPPDSTIHADFAAINVNFWITPTTANLDPSSGGMVIYDIDAPPAWDFHTYNERIEVIRTFLSSHNPRILRVPYRQNRAIIFNSDLFHATEFVHFRPEYRSHRINITMLYGQRSEDHHHPHFATERAGGSFQSTSWRSSAFQLRRC